MFYEMRRKDRLLTEKDAKKYFPRESTEFYPQLARTAIPTAFP